MRTVIISSAILLAALAYSCGSGCRVTYDYFAVITNTLSSPVTVEFRSLYYEWPQKTLSIEPGETSYTWMRRDETRKTHKAPVITAFCKQDDHELETEAEEFSNATLAQYTICRTNNIDVETYAVLATGGTCTISATRETRGW